MADMLFDMVANEKKEKKKVADMELDMMADMKVDKVAAMIAPKNDIDIDIVINVKMQIQFGERVGHGGWLIGPKLFLLEAYPACVSSKLCEFIFQMKAME